MSTAIFTGLRRILAYCRLLGFLEKSDDFVEHLRQKLVRVASEVDKTCDIDKQFTIFTRFNSEGYRLRAGYLKAYVHNELNFFRMLPVHVNFGK